MRNLFLVASIVVLGCMAYGDSFYTHGVTLVSICGTESEMRLLSGPKYLSGDEVKATASADAIAGYTKLVGAQDGVLISSLTKSCVKAVFNPDKDFRSNDKSVKLHTDKYIADVENRIRNFKFDKKRIDRDAYSIGQKNLDEIKQFLPRAPAKTSPATAGIPPSGAAAAAAR